MKQLHFFWNCRSQFCNGHSYNSLQLFLVHSLWWGSLKSDSVTENTVLFGKMSSDGLCRSAGVDCWSLSLSASANPSFLNMKKLDGQMPVVLKACVIFLGVKTLSNAMPTSPVTSYTVISLPCICIHLFITHIVGLFEWPINSCVKWLKTMIILQWECHQMDSIVFTEGYCL